MPVQPWNFSLLLMSFWLDCFAARLISLESLLRNGLPYFVSIFYSEKIQESDGFSFDDFYNFITKIIEHSESFKMEMKFSASFVDIFFYLNPFLW